MEGEQSSRARRPDQVSGWSRGGKKIVLTGRVGAPAVRQAAPAELESVAGACRECRACAPRCGYSLGSLAGRDCRVERNGIRHPANATKLGRQARPHASFPGPGTLDEFVPWAGAALALRCWWLYWPAAWWQHLNNLSGCWPRLIRQSRIFEMRMPARGICRCYPEQASSRRRGQPVAGSVDGGAQPNRSQAGRCAPNARWLQLEARPT